MLKKRGQSGNGSLPAPDARWSFEGEARDSVGELHGELLGGAVIRNGPLILDGVAANMRTVPLDRDIHEKTLLSLAASVEKNASHPLADAVVRKAGEAAVPLESSTEFTTFGGKGVAARVLGEEVIIGNRALMPDRGIGIAGDQDTMITGLEQDDAKMTMP